MSFTQTSPVLVIFCRRPVSGQGKSRIAREIGTDATLEVAQLLLETTLEDARGWHGPVAIAPSSAADARWAAQLLPDALIIPQGEGNLGNRITAVCSKLHEIGHNKMLCIGSDSPALTPELLVKAAARLEENDVVLIPAADGGVTLMGTRTPWPRLDELSWGTDQLQHQLTEACKDSSQSVYHLHTSFDIDTLQDLKHAKSYLASDKRPGRCALLSWVNRLPSDNQSALAISVIVPVYNDVDALGNLLSELKSLQPLCYEIIVVEGGTTSAAKRLCESQGIHYCQSEANRGLQLRSGARQASGEILWFLHADCVPDKNATLSICNHIERGANSGHFKFRFLGKRQLLKKALEIAINWRAAFGVPYGDQAIFIRKEVYFQLQGHQAVPLFEDTQLIKRLRKIDECQAVPSHINVSQRRWQKDGWIRRTWNNRRLAIAHALGSSPEELARRYYSQETSNDSLSK